MADIFISYSKQESELTIALARDLERRGYTTWWDTSLQPGEEFPERILTELDNAKVVIVIWTADSVISRWVQAEAKWAADKNKLITVRSPELDPGRIPLPFNTRHTDLVTDREKIFGALVGYNISPRFERRGSTQNAVAVNSRGRVELSDRAPNSANPARPKSLTAKLIGEARRRRLRTHLLFDKVYLGVGIVLIALTIGAIKLIEIAPILNHTLVAQLELNPAGVELQGRYLYPSYMIIFNIIALSTVFIAFSALSAAFMRRKRPFTSPEVVGLKQDMDDIVRYVKNIIGYLYGAEQDVPRFDILDVNVRYDVSANGDTSVNAEFEIHCTKDAAHFWTYWINADTESDAVIFQRQLYFEVVDVETMQKLDWLPALNDPLHKSFAIFFPEVKPGDRKTLRLSYFWPGFMKKLTALGATNFDWSYRSQNPEKRAHCRVEWIFHADMPVIRCRATGRRSKTALLKFLEQEGRAIWVYEDTSAIMDSTTYSVEFSVA